MNSQTSAVRRVGHVFEPSQYRVYPDTPFDEVVDLMVRRGVRAVPVVGEDFEVLGIITAGDALSRLVGEPTESSHGPDEELTARHVMTRAVLCVSEAEPLPEAARTMVQRNVDQLPVVRDGRLVGLLTREAALGALRALDEPDHDDTEALKPHGS